MAVGNRGTSPVSENSLMTGIPSNKQNKPSKSDIDVKKSRGFISRIRNMIKLSILNPSENVLSLLAVPSGLAI